MANKRVAILGGGIGGLTAAHELLERGYKVDLYEKEPIFGGKARSYEKTGQKGGILNLPTEHGFHMLAGFYKHLPDTMKRIPIAGQANGVLDNLVDTKITLIATKGTDPLVKAPNRLRSLEDLRAAVKALLKTNRFDIPLPDRLFLVGRLLAVLMACDERRYDQLENVDWWDFIQAANRSLDYQRFFAIGPTRTMVACKADKISARTGGVIGLQLAMGSISGTTDRILNGPTNEVLINPWVEFLKRFPDFKKHRRKVTALTYSERNNEIKFQYEDSGASHEIAADYYVCALPVEVVEGLLKDFQAKNPKDFGALVKQEEKFGTLDRLTVARMNGIQFYLKKDVKINPGHIIHIDSPWGLTSISEQQFWSRSYTSPISGILSVDISDWDTPCDHKEHAPRIARQMSSAADIADEVWLQLKDSINSHGFADQLDDRNLADWILDNDVVVISKSQIPSVFTLGSAQNSDLEPLLINVNGSWQYRPNADTNVDNLVLAADYVRTYSDIATMEGANEAARRAVNALLDRDGSSEKRCDIFPLEEPPIFKPFRDLDALNYRSSYSPFGSKRGTLQEYLSTFESISTLPQALRPALGL